MSHTACQGCRSLLRPRFREKLLHLQISRRRRSTSRTPLQPLESWYWDTLPPNPRQLAAANWFFDFHRPQKLWTASEWRQHHHFEGDTEILTPEIAFLGRSNVGKSSLLNALLNEPDLNKVGAKPGKTKVMHAYGLVAQQTGKANRGSKHAGAPSDKSEAGVSTTNLITVLDAPGYGFASQADWGRDIIKYLSRRRHLRRVFVLIDAMHGLKPTDFQMLDFLREQAISHQIIATKCDRLEPPSKRQELLNKSMKKVQEAIQPPNLRSAVVGLGEILAVGSLGDGKSNTSMKPAQMQGLGAVQWAVLRAAGLEQYALNHFNMLPHAVEYDDSPTLPNATRRAVPSAGSIPEPLSVPSMSPNSESTWMNENSNAMTATSVETVTPPNSYQGQSRKSQTHRAADRKARSKEYSGQVTRRASQEIDRVREPGSGMQALLEAASESKRKPMKAVAPKRKKSKRKNPFAG